MKSKCFIYDYWIRKAIKLYYKNSKVVILRENYDVIKMSYSYIILLPDNMFTITVSIHAKFKNFNNVFYYIKNAIENHKTEVKWHL